MLQNHTDIELYEELAAKLDVNLAKARMTYACHASVCFLHATANMRSFEEAIAALYGIEFALHAGWTPAKAAQSIPSPWQEFVDLWGGEGIAQWVRSLGSIIDSLAIESTERTRELMIESFRTALHHRLRFWDMAFEEADW
jgi:thiaminase